VGSGRGEEMVKEGDYERGTLYVGMQRSEWNPFLKENCMKDEQETIGRGHKRVIKRKNIIKLYSCMEISQWNSHIVQLICANTKVISILSCICITLPVYSNFFYLSLPISWRVFCKHWRSEENWAKTYEKFKGLCNGK
jgi:hypothetical protein